MRDIVEILDHWDGRSIQATAASLGLDRKTVRKYVGLAEQAGFEPGQRPPKGWGAWLDLEPAGASWGLTMRRALPSAPSRLADHVRISGSAALAILRSRRSLLGVARSTTSDPYSGISLVSPPDSSTATSTMWKWMM